jgi:FMN reductase
MTTPVTVVVGNPKALSRTRTAGEASAAGAATAAGLDPAVEVTTIDLADYGPELFDWSSARVKELVNLVSGSSLLIVASPTYKATYTGLLKAFLDWFGQTGLSGVTAVPVMIGAGLGHAMAVEVHLRPLLVEIGATVPTRGLYVLESQLDDLASVIDPWLIAATGQLRANLTAP